MRLWYGQDGFTGQTTHREHFADHAAAVGRMVAMVERIQ